MLPTGGIGRPPSPSQSQATPKFPSLKKTLPEHNVKKMSSEKLKRREELISKAVVNAEEINEFLDIPDSEGPNTDSMNLDESEMVDEDVTMVNVEMLTKNFRQRKSKNYVDLPSDEEAIDTGNSITVSNDFKKY